MQITEIKIKTTLHVCGNKICTELTISYHCVTVQEQENKTDCKDSITLILLIGANLEVE